MVCRTIRSTQYNFRYDAENHLVQVQSSVRMDTFVYDGDGNRVKGTLGGVTTAYVGNHFEWTGSTSTMKKYYYAGGQRVAMRTGTTMLNYLLSDHLGSTNVTANSSGGWQGDLLYKPWGEIRYTWGTTPTTYRYTGQREQAEIGLYYYGARWYDPALGRWAQPDTLIPEQSQGVQAWDRMAYTSNNPVKYNDPTGHCIGPLLAICLAIIEAAPVIVEAVELAVFTYIATSQVTINQPTINGEEVNIGIIVLPGGGIPQLPSEPEILGSNADLLVRTTVGNLAHTQMGAQYLETIPEEQIPYVGIEANFADAAGRFRPDIVNQITGEIVDFKPLTYASGPYHSEAITQAESYVDRLTTMFGDMRILDGAPSYWYRLQYYNMEDYIP
jgi:RHS repeat-associated protein